jgi:hypothetical protein
MSFNINRYFCSADSRSTLPSARLLYLTTENRDAYSRKKGHLSQNGVDVSEERKA